MLMARIELTASAPPKGRPPLRQRPDDFEVIFVEQGRVGCEPWYRARRDTVTRWMKECDTERFAAGLPMLIAARAAFVAHQRSQGNWITRQTPLVTRREVRKASRAPTPIRDRRKVSPTLARHAAQHLRIRRNGGMIVSPAGDGEWWVGSKRLSAAQMLDLAKSHGFDDAVVALDDGEMPVAAAAKSQRPSTMPTVTAEWTEHFKARWLHENGNADYRLGGDSEDLSEDLHPFTRSGDKDE